MKKGRMKEWKPSAEAQMELAKTRNRVWYGYRLLELGYYVFLFLLEIIKIRRRKPVEEQVLERLKEINEGLKEDKTDP